MVFVKVRETYDLHTLTDKISLIGIHTPASSIIRRNYPGLLMQCKAYRPVKADVRMACASVLPLDPNGVGVDSGQVAPEDVFNPILYKAISNFGMSQIEAYVNAGGNFNILGSSLDAGNNGITSDDFAVYYGLLAQTHEWKHANPQAGLEMNGLKPLVYETYQTVGDNTSNGAQNPMPMLKGDDTVPTGQVGNIAVQTYRGRAHEMPMLNCTNLANFGAVVPGFGSLQTTPGNVQTDIPAPKVFCGLIVVPPSRRVSLYYRLVCEWTLEFSMIRPLADITTWAGLQQIGNTTHYTDYSYDNSKTFNESTGMVDTSEGSDIKKIM